MLLVQEELHQEYPTKPPVKSLLDTIPLAEQLSMVVDLANPTKEPTHEDPVILSLITLKFLMVAPEVYPNRPTF